MNTMTLPVILCLTYLSIVLLFGYIIGILKKRRSSRRRKKVRGNTGNYSYDKDTAAAPNKLNPLLSPLAEAPAFMAEAVATRDIKMTRSTVSVVAITVYNRRNEMHTHRIASW